MLAGVHFKKALFVPNTSVYYKVGTASSASDTQVDVSWQMTLQKTWEILVLGEKGICLLNFPFSKMFYSGYGGYAYKEI